MDSYIELSDGSQLELRIPSGSQTGLKLTHSFTVADGTTTDFTIDFDLRKSITNPAGMSAAILRPTLRLVETVQVGSIFGMIDPSLAATSCTDTSINDGAVYVYSGADVTPVDRQGTESDPITTALVEFMDGSYSYELGFLEAGDYTVAFTCDNDIDSATEHNFI